MRFSIRSLVLLAVVALAPIATTVGCAASRASHAHATEAARRQEERQSLAAHRTHQIARLHEYAERGVFPRNLEKTAAPVHMFKDVFGTRCAVANLIHLDGQSDLVDKMHREHNDVVVADETSGPLHDWVLSSGLTNEEVRRIQGIGFAFENNNPQGIVLFDVATPEHDRLQAELRAVEKELLANTDASLEIATARRLENPTRVAMR